MTDPAPRRDLGRQWDPERAGPVNRWFLKHVFGPPGGFSRFLGCVLLVFAVGFAVLTVVLLNDPDALQSDKDFFPFITAFFVVCSLPFFVAWLVARGRDRRRRRG